MLKRADIKLTYQQKWKYKNAEKIKEPTCPEVEPKKLGNAFFNWVELKMGLFRGPEGELKEQTSNRGYLDSAYYGDMPSEVYSPAHYLSAVDRKFGDRRVPWSPGEKNWIHAAIETKCLKNVKDAFPKLFTGSLRMKKRANEPGFDGNSPLQQAISKKQEYSSGENDDIIAYLISQGGELTDREKEEPLYEYFSPTDREYYVQKWKEDRWERGLIE